MHEALTSGLLCVLRRSEVWIRLASRLRPVVRTLAAELEHKTREAELRTGATAEVQVHDDNDK